MDSPFSGGLTAVKPDSPLSPVAVSAEPDAYVRPARSPNRPRRKVKRDGSPCTDTLDKHRELEPRRDNPEHSVSSSRLVPAHCLRPPLSPSHHDRHHDVLNHACSLFKSSETSSEAAFIEITKVAGLPRYLNRAFFVRCGGTFEGEGVTSQQFTQVWSSLLNCRDADELAFGVLQTKGPWLSEDDFRVVIEDVCANHPGLQFLADMPVFQTRYVDTVVTRIFYDKTRNLVPRMTLKEFRKDGVLNLLLGLEREDDINMTRNAFSYKHFYVIYCKFWELDTDHDLHISLPALTAYENACLSVPILKRVYSGAGAGRHSRNDALMSYQDFIWFILSVEDKASRPGTEYWFRCLDVDGDGVLSLWELQAFFEEQAKRMDEWKMSDLWKWSDFLCAILDMINPVDPTRITINDLRRSNNAALIFDMLFDIRKYDLHLRRIDPGFRDWDDLFAFDQKGERVKLEGWDKFAERAYDDLAFDEGQNDSGGSSPTFSTSGFYMDDSDLWEEEPDLDSPVCSPDHSPLAHGLGVEEPVSLTTCLDAMSDRVQEPLLEVSLVAAEETVVPMVLDVAEPAIIVTAESTKEVVMAMSVDSPDASVPTVTIMPATGAVSAGVDDVTMAADDNLEDRMI
ncbi:hypothetical protein DFS34DRAFT_696063 [Phlyctochytrium arcticum]|nr:hypothetical protein DFS34DRAFT_696063 [Phlyctochytrium arcticum]